MKKTLFLMLMLLSVTLSAQVKITGKIETKTKNPLEFAEIILISKDSVAVKSELTNEKGVFILETGQYWYKLQIRKADKILFSKTCN